MMHRIISVAALPPMMALPVRAADSPHGMVAADGTTDVALLSQAWNAFCDELKKTGQIPIAATLPGNEQDRVAGYLQLFRNLSLAFDFHYEFNDPLFPEFMRYFGPTRKQGGDNSDAVYVGATISGDYDYRISGYRGTARYMSIVLVDEGDTPWGGKASRPLFGHEIETDENGRFELIISRKRHAGNWMKSGQNTFRVTIRQYFADWENERPMRAFIERISGPKVRAPALSQKKLADGLVESVRWLQQSVVYWPEMLERWRPYRNLFKSYWALEENKIDATPGGDPLVCYWELAPEDALIIRVRPPRCPYWCVEFGNCWWETVDYRYRLANTNMHYAQMEDNGDLIVVVSHVDPGVPNWLDCSGFSCGYVTYRWMLSEEQPVPKVEQVEIEKLPDFLPKDVKRISPDQRAEQIRTRRRGMLARFGN